VKVESIGTVLEAMAGDIGRTVRRRREALGWSQADLAEQMTALGQSWHQTSAAKVEAGSRPIRWNEAVALALVLGFPRVDSILGEASPVPNLVLEMFVSREEERTQASVEETRSLVMRTQGQAAVEVFDELMAKARSDYPVRPAKIGADSSDLERTIESLRHKSSRERGAAMELLKRAEEKPPAKPPGDS